MSIPSDSAYIRPCAAFPDGMMLPMEIVPTLIEDGLIEPAAADVENVHPNDYAAIYDEQDMDVVVRDIEDAIRDYIAPWRTLA